MDMTFNVRNILISAKNNDRIMLNIVGSILVAAVSVVYISDADGVFP